MKIQNPKSTEAAQILQLTSLLDRGISSILKAGELLCRMTEKDRKVIDRIVASNPQVSRFMLYTLERVGNKQVIPELFLMVGAAARRLQHLDIEFQRKAISGPLTLLVSSTGSSTKLVPLEKLSDAQSRQAMDETGKKLRSLAGQREWLVAHERGMALAATRPNWFVEKGTLVVTSCCRMTVAQLERVLAELKKA